MMKKILKVLIKLLRRRPVIYEIKNAEKARFILMFNAEYLDEKDMLDMQDTLIKILGIQGVIINSEDAEFKLVDFDNVNK